MYTLVRKWLPTLPVLSCDLLGVGNQSDNEENEEEEGRNEEKKKEVLSFDQLRSMGMHVSVPRPRAPKQKLAHSPPLAHTTDTPAHTTDTPAHTTDTPAHTTDTPAHAHASDESTYAAATQAVPSSSAELVLEYYSGSSLPMDPAPMHKDEEKVQQQEEEHDKEEEEKVEEEEETKDHDKKKKGWLRMTVWKNKIKVKYIKKWILLHENMLKNNFFECVHVKSIIYKK